MKRLVLGLVVFLSIVVVVIYLALPALVRGNREATRAVMMQTQYSCPEGSIEKIDNWGAIGFSRFCTKNDVKHGKWMAWEGKRLVIDGSYLDGQHHGKWMYFDGKGFATRVIEYDRGKVLKDSLTGKRSGVVVQLHNES
jgi:hypothetical protein